MTKNRKPAPGGVPPEIARSPEYAKAKSCSRCTDTCDSFNRYVSTYCHLHHEHLAGFGGQPCFRCADCKDYSPREPVRKGARRR